MPSTNELQRTRMKFTAPYRRKFDDGCQLVQTGHLAFDISTAAGELLIRCRNGRTGWRRFFHHIPVFEDAAGERQAWVELPLLIGTRFTLCLPTGERLSIEKDKPVPESIGGQLALAVSAFRDILLRSDPGSDGGDD